MAAVAGGMAIMMRGVDLCPEDRAEVLAKYVYRVTVENELMRPEAVRQTRSRMKRLSDAEWLMYTEFEVNEDGRLKRGARFCRTVYPDWAYPKD